jgi:hypothetical protein
MTELSTIKELIGSVRFLFGRAFYEPMDDPIHYNRPSQLLKPFRPFRSILAGVLQGVLCGCTRTCLCDGASNINNKSRLNNLQVDPNYSVVQLMLANIGMPPSLHTYSDPLIQSGVIIDSTSRMPYPDEFFSTTRSLGSSFSVSSWRSISCSENVGKHLVGISKKNFLKRHTMFSNFFFTT